MSLQAIHAQLCSDSNRTLEWPQKPFFGLQQALQKQQILQKALLKISGGGVSAKCNYVKFKAFQHNLSTVSGRKTALFWMTKNPVQFILQTTDHTEIHTGLQPWTCEQCHTHSSQTHVHTQKVRQYHSPCACTLTHTNVLPWLCRHHEASTEVQACSRSRSIQGQ